MRANQHQDLLDPGFAVFLATHGLFVLKIIHIKIPARLHAGPGSYLGHVPCDDQIFRPR